MLLTASICMHHVRTVGRGVCVRVVVCMSLCLLFLPIASSFFAANERRNNRSCAVTADDDMKEQEGMLTQMMRRGVVALCALYTNDDASWNRHCTNKNGREEKEKRSSLDINTLHSTSDEQHNSQAHTHTHTRTSIQHTRLHTRHSSRELPLPPLLLLPSLLRVLFGRCDRLHSS